MRGRYKGGGGAMKMQRGMGMRKKRRKGRGMEVSAGRKLEKWAKVAKRISRSECIPFLC